MTALEPTAASATEGERLRRRVLAGCCLSLVLVVLAVTSVNIAIPPLQRGLGASATELLWIVDVYALVFACMLLPAGALGDRYGPVVAVDAALVARYVPTSRDPARTRLDPIGAALSVVGLLSLLFAIIEGPERGWTEAPVVGTFVAAGLLLAAFVVWELRSAHPMLDPRFFRIPAFSSGAATITVIFFVMFGMFFLIAQYLQFVQGHSPLEAAVRMLPSGLTMIVVAPRGPALAARIGRYRSTGLGLLGAAGGFVMLAELGPDTGYAWLAAALVLMAAGSALAMPSATAAIVGSLPPAKAGVGSAVNDVTREAGGAVGIAVLGSIVSVLYRNDIADTAARLPGAARAAVEESIGSAVAIGSSETATATLDAARQAFTTATHTVFLLAAALMAIGALLSLRMHRSERQRYPAPVTVGSGSAATAGYTPSEASVPCAR